MTITLATRDLSLSPAMRERAESLAQRFSHYFTSVQRVEWGFSRDADDVVVSCRIHSRSGYYRASARASSVRTGLDLAVEKVLKQRRRKKVVLQRRRRSLD